MLQTRSDSLRVWVVNTAAAGGASVVVTNTPLPVIINNSGGLFAMQSGAWAVSSTILNSAGWIFAQSNTNNMGVILQNSGGLFAQQSGAWAVSSTILNSAGWIVAVSNTQANVNITNSAGWVVFDIDSAAVGAVVTAIASTIGAVTLAASQTKRVALSIYNASTNPMFMKLGAGASTASYTLMMVGSGYYELPRPIYNGIITGIWQTANGSAYISETT